GGACTAPTRRCARCASPALGAGASSSATGQTRCRWVWPFRAQRRWSCSPSSLRIVAGYWRSAVQYPVAHFACLIVQLVVKRERADVAPEAVEPIALHRGARANYLEDTTGGLQGALPRRDFAGRDGGGALAALFGSQRVLTFPGLLQASRGGVE